MTTMMERPIGYIPGEGCGPAIIESALAVLKEIERIKDIKFQYVEYEGKAPALEYTDESFRQLKKFYQDIKDKGGCIIRGAIYARQVYQLRHAFNMTFKPILINPLPELRAHTPLREDFAQKINLLIIRENAQGLLMGKEKLTTKKGKQCSVTFDYDEALCRQFVEHCYAAAQKRNKKIMFLIKGDVWDTKKLGGLWLDLWKEVGARYPDVAFDWDHEDTWFGYFLLHPERYDTVAALGLAGDILTDSIATLAYGTRAVTPSANIAPDGFMVFQTIHGTGTGIPAGQANPIAAIRAVGMMMDYFYGMPDLREQIDHAIRQVLARGYRTIDLCSGQHPDQTLVGTKEMTELIVRELEVRQPKE